MRTACQFGGVFFFACHRNNANVNVAFLHFHSRLYESNEFKSQFCWIRCRELCRSENIFKKDASLRLKPANVSNDNSIGVGIAHLTTVEKP